MKTWWLYLKSHSEAPDYEDYFNAETEEEAVEHWYNEFRKYPDGAIDKETIANNIGDLT